MVVDVDILYMVQFDSGHNLAVQQILFQLQTRIVVYMHYYR